MDDLVKQIRDMEERVQAVEEVGLKILSAVRFGKFLGVEDRIKNNMSAKFILDKQIKKLKEIIGSDNINCETYIRRLEDQAEEILEFLIETYTPIIDEIKNGNIMNIGGTKFSGSELNRSKRVKEEVSGNSWALGVIEEPVDFSNADIKALENFWGAGED